MASDFQSMFGADTGDFSGVSGEAKAAFDTAFGHIINSLKGSTGQFKSTADQIRVIAEMEDMRRESVAKGTTTLKEFLTQQTKFIKDLKSAKKPFQDLNSSLKAIRVAVDKEVAPKLQKLGEKQKQQSKAYSAAVAQVGKGIVETSNQMYSSAANTVSFYRFWLSDMPKKFGGAFTKIGDVLKGWGEKSKAKKELKTAQNEYEKFTKAIKSSSQKSTSSVVGVLKDFVSKAMAQTARFKTNSEAFERYMRRMNAAMKPPGGGGGKAGSTPPGSPGGGDGTKLNLAEGAGRIFGSIGSGLGTIGSIASAIGGIIANGMELAIKEAQLELQSKFASYEGFKSQGIFSDKAFGDVFKEFGHLGARRIGEFLKTGSAGMAIEFEKNQGKFNQVFHKYGLRITDASRTIFEGLELGNYVDTIVRRNLKKGQDYSDQFVQTFTKLTAYTTVLSDAAKKLHISPKVAAASLRDLNESLMEMNESLETGTSIIAGFMDMGENFKAMGVDMQKSLGSMTKSFVESVKKWDKGLKTFAAMQAFGGSPFAAYYKSQQGGPGSMQAMLKPMFGIMEQIGTNMKGVGEKFMVSEEYLSKTLGIADNNLVKVISDSFEKTGNFDAVLTDSKYSKQLEQAIKVANMAPEQLQKGSYTMQERQLSIELMQLQLQKLMLAITTSALNVALGLLLKIAGYLGTLGTDLKLGLMKAFSFIPGMKGAYEKEKQRIDTSNDMDAVSYRWAKKTEERGDKLFDKHWDKFTVNMNKLVDELNPETGNFGKTMKQLDSSFEKLDQGIVDLGNSVKGINNDLKDSFKKPTATKRHFGGSLEKFHYGGIIKQGTEALLMSPNPTSVLSPADTRQAVRGGSEKGDVNIHFHAPVYGIPKFKEMVKDTVMQYASGIR